ncbi:hypothetical protein DKP78_26110, partial [Enterococcus faecium]
MKVQDERNSLLHSEHYRVSQGNHIVGVVRIAVPNTVHERKLGLKKKRKTRAECVSLSNATHFEEKTRYTNRT